MAYVLGFMYADGSLDVNPRGSEYFSLHVADKILLENIRNALQSEHKIAHRKRKDGTGHYYRLQVGSKYMCNELRTIGLCKYKTHVMSLPNIPDEYLSHFVRGYFDGDGNVWIGEVHKNRKRSTFVMQTVFTSSSKKFLTSLQDQLINEGLGKGSVVMLQNAYRLQYSVKDSILLYRLMYRDTLGGLELSRKKKIFEKYLNIKNNTRKVHHRASNEK